MLPRDHLFPDIFAKTQFHFCAKAKPSLLRQTKCEFSTRYPRYVQPAPVLKSWDTVGAVTTYSCKKDIYKADANNAKCIQRLINY
jgi:hypothetical protein